MPSDTFLVGINFEDTYANFPDSAGYVGVFHTLEGCSDPGISNFETYFDNNNDYVTVPLIENYPGLDIELVMSAVVSTEINTSTRQPLADYAASITPNPAGELVNLRFEAHNTGRYTASLFDLSGRTVRRTSSDNTSGSVQIDWEVNDLPAGMYLFHIDGPAGRQSGKLMVN